MKYFLMTISIAALAVLPTTATWAASQMIWFENTMNSPDNGGKAALWNDPHAATGGALWVQGAGSPALLTQDVNLRLEVNAPDGHGGYAWTTLVTLLRSAPSGQVPTAANDWVGDATGDYSFMAMAGAFSDPAGQTYAIPNTNFATGPNGSYAMRLWAWAGTDSTFAAAVAGGQYVGFSGAFNQAVSYGGPMPTAADLTNLPAVVLRHSLPGDANLDGRVDVTDLNKALTNYNRSGMTWSDGDFSGEGAVEVGDLNKVLTNYDKSVGSSAAAAKAVPEPSSLVLLGVGAVSLLHTPGDAGEHERRVQSSFG